MGVDWFELGDPMKLKNYFTALVAMALAIQAGAQVPVPPKIVGLAAGDVTIGWETTRITGPLRRNGTVDYIAAINDKMGRGMGADENAAVVLARIVGPDFATPPTWKLLWKSWNLSEPAAAGSPWINFEKYRQSKGERVDFGKVDASGLAIRNGWPKEPGLLKSWIDTQQQPLDEMARASKRPGFYLPCVPSHQIDCLFYAAPVGIFECRNLNEALCCRALMRLSAKDYVGFETDIAAAYAWGKKLGSTTTLINRMIGLAIEGDASMTMLAAIRSGDMPGQVITALAAMMGGLPKTAPLAEALDTGERWNVLDFMEACADLGPQRASSLAQPTPSPAATKNELGIKYDEVMRRVNENYDRMITAARLPTFAARQKASAEYDNEMAAKEKKYDTPLAIGLDYQNFLIVTLMPHLGRAFAVETGNLQREDLVRVVLALEQFRVKNGSYPEALEMPEGEFLKAIPADRFIEAPLHYSLKQGGYLIYSVGENMKDDGGNSTDGKDDVSFEMAGAMR